MNYPSLTALLDAARKATPGPLHVEGRRVMADNGWLVAEVTGPNPRTRGKEWREENECCLANADLIALARNSIEELQLLMKRLERVEKLVGQWDDWAEDATLDDAEWAKVQCANDLRSALEAPNNQIGEGK